MKKIIIVLILLTTVSQASFSQIAISFDSSSIMRWGRSYINDDINDTVNYRITFWQDGKLEVQGDTIGAIKRLFKDLQSKDSTIESMYDFQAAAVDFTNEVPDYWKSFRNNCKWNKYNRELKKQGYITVPLKKTKSPCK